MVHQLANRKPPRNDPPIGADAHHPLGPLRRRGHGHRNKLGDNIVNPNQPNNSAELIHANRPVAAAFAEKFQKLIQPGTFGNKEHGPNELRNLGRPRLRHSFRSRQVPANIKQPDGRPVQGAAKNRKPKSLGRRDGFLHFAGRCGFLNPGHRDPRRHDIPDAGSPQFDDIRKEPLVINGNLPRSRAEIQMQPVPQP